MIDTHCHLCDRRFDRDRTQVFDRARHAGVRRFVEIAYAPGLWERAFALAADHPDVYVAVGVHPGEAGRVPADALAALRDHARHPRVVAIWAWPVLPKRCEALWATLGLPGAPGGQRDADAQPRFGPGAARALGEPQILFPRLDLKSVAGTP